MTVYIQGSMLGEEYAGPVKAEVTAVREHGVDLRLENGARLMDWRAKVYDENENEIPLERIRRDFVSGDTAALMARVAALEIMMTDV